MKQLITVLVALLFFCSAAGNAELIDNGDGTITQIRNDGSTLMWLQDVPAIETLVCDLLSLGMLVRVDCQCRPEPTLGALDGFCA